MATMSGWRSTMRRRSTPRSRIWSRPEKARKYGIKALDRALADVGGTTAVHICFGYAAVVKDKPSGYSFLPEFERSAVDQVSIEVAQPKLDLSVLQQLPSKTIILGV